MNKDAALPACLLKDVLTGKLEESRVRCKVLQGLWRSNKSAIRTDIRCARIAVRRRIKNIECIYTKLYTMFAET